jgi:hypothetical protein
MRKHDPADGVDSDLHEYARREQLDAYELTDRELAELLEVWRWRVWHTHTRPTPTDRDAAEAVRALRRQLAREHDLDLDYNTFYLLREECTPLLHLRALWAGYDALVWFAHPRRWPLFWRTLWRAWRCARTPSVPEEAAPHLLYPRDRLERARLHAPDLLRRRYWRPIGGASLDVRKQTDEWN